MKSACPECGNWVEVKTKKWNGRNSVCQPCYRDKQVFERENKAHKAAKKRASAANTEMVVDIILNPRKAAAVIFSNLLPSRNARGQGKTPAVNESIAKAEIVAAIDQRPPPPAPASYTPMGCLLGTAIGAVPGFVVLRIMVEVMGLVGHHPDSIVMITVCCGIAGGLLSPLLAPFMRKRNANIDEAIEQGSPIRTPFLSSGLTRMGCLLYVLWVPIAVPIGAVCSLVLVRILQAIGLVGTGGETVNTLTGMFACIGIGVSVVAPLVVVRFKRKRNASIHKANELTPDLPTEKRTLVQPESDKVEKAMAEEGADYGVWITSIGKRKIAVIKLVRKATGLGLKEAKDLVESTPVRVKTGLSHDAAIELGVQFEAIGAVIDLRKGGHATLSIPSVPDSVAEQPAPVNEKECPMCAEDVKLRAKICRFCGHQFEVVS